MNNDGGPAFPIPAADGRFLPQGMSLRQWYAGQALSGLLAYAENDAAWIANKAFEYADAMINEGNK